MASRNSPFQQPRRIQWGKVSDNLGRKGTLVLMFLLCGSRC
jgi:hypothetical protein